MDCVDPIPECLNAILFIPLVGELQALVKLEESAVALFSQMDDLRSSKKDMENFVLGMETPWVKRTDSVKAWMERVDSLDGQVDDFEEAFVRRTTCFLRCSLDTCWSNYKLCRRAASLLRQLSSLKNQENFGKLVSTPLPEPVEVVQSSSSSIVGAEETLSAIRRHLRSEGPKILGIYGMGGIGKTTLLLAINDELCISGTSDYNLVIWVKVSKNLNIFKIQEQIGFRLGYLSDGERHLPAEEKDRAEILFEALSQKKYLLLLDDVWDKLDFEKIGIPRPNNKNKSKIAFTTRSQETCSLMDAEGVKVMFLNDHQSWELFSGKVGKGVDLNDQSIKPLAKSVVERCGGLPLALITVGRSMAKARTASEWKKAIGNLSGSSELIRGMPDVLSLVKFSYDRLESYHLRWCLLYCSLYPDDFDIPIADIVELWIGEGHFDYLHQAGIDRARNKGLVFIRKLKLACLLESGRDGEIYVKMHDVVREMALSTLRGDSSQTRVLSKAGLGMTQFPLDEKLEEVNRLSLIYNEIEELPEEMPNCTCLQTLLISNNLSLTRSIPDSFFRFMPVLCVLDLSRTGIEELPASIGSLVELRFLDVSWTGILSLPKELGNLVKLKQLDLRGTRELRVVHREEILKLSELQVLNLSASNYMWDCTLDDYEQDIHMNPADLERLEKLEDLGLTIGTVGFLKILLTSPVLSKAITSLHLMAEDVTTVDLSATFEIMQKLQHLEISYGEELKEILLSSGQLLRLQFLILYGLPKFTKLTLIKEVVEGTQRPLVGFHSLVRLDIVRCHELKDLEWVQLIPNLQYLKVDNCSGIEELVLDGGEEEMTGENASFFRNLRWMRLQWLPNLRSICNHPLSLSSFETLEVYGCPKLKKLLLRPIKEVYGFQEWWDGLEWEANIKSRSLPDFYSVILEKEEEESEWEEEAKDEMVEEGEVEQGDQDEVDYVKEGGCEKNGEERGE